MGHIVLVGFNNSVPAGRLVAVLSARGAAASKLRKLALASHRLLDARKGAAVKSLVVLDTNHVILSSIRPTTLVQRFEEALKGAIDGNSQKRGKRKARVPLVRNPV